jgi:hypothetical protein
MPIRDTQHPFRVASAKEKTNLIRKTMNIDPTTSTLKEKREHTSFCFFQTFAVDFKKPKHAHADVQRSPNSEQSAQGDKTTKVRATFGWFGWVDGWNSDL